MLSIVFGLSIAVFVAMGYSMMTPAIEPVIASPMYQPEPKFLKPVQFARGQQKLTFSVASNNQTMYANDGPIFIDWVSIVRTNTRKERRSHAFARHMGVHTEDDIRNKCEQIVRAAVREVIENQSRQSIVHNQRVFTQSVCKTAESELAAIGLEMLVFNIRNIEV